MGLKPGDQENNPFFCKMSTNFSSAFKHQMPHGAGDDMTEQADKHTNYYTWQISEPTMCMINS